VGEVPLLLNSELFRWRFTSFYSLLCILGMVGAATATSPALWSQKTKRCSWLGFALHELRSPFWGATRVFFFFSLFHFSLFFFN
jgi:hypothetical protein